jgi:hypothetical protein
MKKLTSINSKLFTSKDEMAKIRGGLAYTSSRQCVVTTDASEKYSCGDTTTTLCSDVDNNWSDCTSSTTAKPCS